jgi:uncharacterized protein (TIGR00730 family)
MSVREGSPALRSLGVFCGSRTGAAPVFAQTAERLGRCLAERDVGLVYGGGGIGLMGVLATTVLEHGGRVTGVIPDFLMRREVGDPGVTELVVVDSMHDRKRRMFELADAFAVLPGGLGTLDEAMEIITWRQLGLHDKPVAVLNVAGYWAGLEALLAGVIEGGFADAAIRDLFLVVDQVDDLLDALTARAAGRAAAASRRL